MGAFSFFHILTISLFICNVSVVLIANGNGSNSIIDVATYKHGFVNFPPGAWLGKGLDMTAVMPLDITAVGFSRELIDHCFSHVLNSHA